MNTSKSSGNIKSRLDEIKLDYYSHRQNWNRLLYGAGPSTSAEKLQVRLFGVILLLVGFAMGVVGIISVFVMPEHLFEYQVVLICAGPILIVLGLITTIRGKLAFGKTWLFRKRREISPNIAQTNSSPYAVPPNAMITTEPEPYPMERLLILFSKRGIVELALIVLGGLIFGLHLDDRIGVFFAGIVFALGGAGHLVALRKNAGSASRLRYFLYALYICVLLFGVFVSIGALLLIIAGVHISPSGM